MTFYALPEKGSISCASRGISLLRSWLLLLIALVFVMVVVGGATRLTGSGLSITEWKPITGAIPPLSAADWAQEFALYRQSPQYQLLNKGMSLGEFQFIYWWEWGHRQLGRFIGLVYMLGFFGFLAFGVIKGRLALAVFGLGLLLGLQGVIGWIMVASGLKPGMIAVAPLKLTLHLTFASFFLAGLVALSTHLGTFGAMRTSSQNLKRGAQLIVVLVFVQIALGGLVAGSKAGFTYNTWPLMDGYFIPNAGALFSTQPLWENFVDNPTLVQFNHRIGAYLLLMAAIWHAFAARGTQIARSSLVIAALVFAQAILGIVTLLLVVPLWAGLFHQAMAMLLLICVMLHAQSVTFHQNESGKANHNLG